MEDLLPQRKPDTVLSAIADTGVVNAREAAKYIGVNERTIRRAIARGELIAVKRGGNFQITVCDLLRYHRRAPGRKDLYSSDHFPVLLTFPDDHRLAHYHLPRPLTSFIGRDAEIATLVDTLARPDTSLLTLVGPGGVGKTRVAIAICEAVGLSSGACFVDLAAVQSADLVQGAIARALGVSANPARPLVDRLAPILTGRQLLLVLDNFEHLLPAAPEVAGLIEKFPQLVILVTSRRPLRISAERIHLVSSLEVELPSVGLETEDAWPTAIQLFTERARAVQEEFNPSPRDFKDIAALCQRLDGLPLAIELAAAKVRVLPVRELLARTTRRLPWLDSGPRDAPARQQTMRDTIAWSYDLLAPEEQAVVRRVAVYVGGISLPALVHVVQDVAPAMDALSMIFTLVDSSLLEPRPLPSGDPRFSMLETIREFGHEMLEHHEQTRDARDSHARFFVGLGRWLDPNILNSDERFDDRLSQIEVELPNVLAALSHLDDVGDLEAILELTGRCAAILHHRGYLAEGRRWLEYGIHLGSSIHSASLGRACAGLSLIQWTQGVYSEARNHAQLALELATALGDEELQALALHMIALTALGQGDLMQGRSYMLRALAQWRNLKLVSAEGMALNVLSIIEHALGDDETAERFAVDCIALFRQVGHASGCAFGTAQLAGLAAAAGNDLSARALYLDSLRDWASIGERWAINVALLGLADIAVRRQQPEIAATLLGAVDVRVETGELVRIVGSQHIYSDITEQLRLVLQPESFDTLRDQGRDLSLAEILILASDISPSAPDNHSGRRSAGLAFDLTPREHQVLLQMVEGLSNRQIAATLYISERTVEHHVQHILGKLGVASRTAAVARAIRDGVSATEATTE